MEQPGRWDRTSLCKGPMTNDGTCQIGYGSGVTTSPTVFIQYHGFFYVHSSSNLFGMMKETTTTALNATSRWFDHLNWERVSITASMILRGIFKNLSVPARVWSHSFPLSIAGLFRASRAATELFTLDRAKKRQLNSPVTAVERLYSKALFLDIGNRQPSESNFSVTFSFVGLSGM